MAASGLAVGAPAASPAETPLDRFLLLRDQVRGAFAFNRTSLAGHFVGALAVELIFSASAPPMLRVAWGALFMLVWLGRVMLAVRFAHNEPGTATGLQWRLRAWQGGVLAAGALWGAAAWFFFDYGGAASQIALVLVVYTFCVASVPILAPQFGVFAVFVLLVFVPAIAAVAVKEPDLGWQAAMVMTVAMGMVMILGRDYRTSFDKNIELKLRTEALAVQLRAEKGAADAARPEAESGQPRQDAVLHRRESRPAPAAACDGPVRRSLAPARARARSSAAGQQHQ